MPPHTTLFARKSLYDKAGLFDTGLKIASDYDMMLRLLKNSPGSIFYSDEILVKMRVGGKSNSSLKGLLKKSSEDYKVLKKNNFSFPSLTLLLKNVRKVKQFFKK
jgi:glycosyltransferase